MALAISPNNACIAEDPRIDVDYAAKPTYVIQKGGELVSRRKETTNSFSSSNVSWKLCPPSTNVIIDKKIYIEIAMRVTITGTVNGGDDTLLAPDFDAPRFMPLNNALIQTATLDFNNSTTSERMSEILDPFLRYQDYRSLVEDYSSSPNMQDNCQDYSDVSQGINNPLGSYENTAQLSANQPRGGFARFNIVSNPVILDGNSGSAVVDCLFVEPLFLSPMTFGKLEEVGLLGISNMNLNLTFNNGSELRRIWSHNPSRGLVTSSITSVSIDVAGGGTGYSNNPICHITYITPRSTQKLPSEVSYPYSKTIHHVTEMNTVNAGANVSVSGPCIQLDSVPKRIYVFARKKTQVRDVNDPDSYLRMETMSVTFDNLTNQLADANSFDLYNMSRKNGLQMTYSDWYGVNTTFPTNGTAKSRKHGSGSVCCLDLAYDLGLPPELAPGVLGRFQLQITSSFYNFSDTNAQYQYFIIPVYEGILSIVQGNTYVQLGCLSPDQVLRTEGKLTGVSYNQLQMFKTYYGGNIVDTVKSLASKGVDLLSNASVVKKCLPCVTELGKSAHPALKGVIEAAEELIGKGCDPEEALVEVMMGGGLLGASQNKMQGSKKASMAKLKSRAL